MPLAFDPELLTVAKPVLDLLATAPKPAVHDVKTRRESANALMGQAAASAPKFDVNVKEHSIKTRDGAEIGIFQISRPDVAPNGPAAVHFHGGGMIAASAKNFLPAMSYQVAQSGVTIFSVDYRLAPEHQDESLVNDCYDGLQWVQTNAQQLGVDPSRLAVLGESAGGGLAAGVALLARDRNFSPPLAKQILICPMLDDRTPKPDPALEPFLLWTYESNVTGWTALLGDKAGKADADVSQYCAPARAKSLEGLPETYMDVGQLDLFVDEDLEYARRLSKGNVTVDFNLFAGFPHAWELLGGAQTSVGQRILAARVEALKSF